MRTALDTSVLILIQTRQAGWEAWRDLITKAATEGPLLICPIVFAEYSMGFASAEGALSHLESIQTHYDPIVPSAAYLAGQTFLRFRREGVLRQRLIPDFLIAAHASIQADRLAAIDRGYLLRYFPSLSLLAPAP